MQATAQHTVREGQCKKDAAIEIQIRWPRLSGHRADKLTTSGKCSSVPTVHIGAVRMPSLIQGKFQR